MITICVNILLIGLIMVFTLDISGFYQEITCIISGWMTNGVIKKPIMIKPFCCSLCMTFWLSLIYILCMGCFTIPMIAYCCLIAYMTPVIADTLRLVTELLKTLIIAVNNKLN